MISKIIRNSLLFLGKFFTYQIKIFYLYFYPIPKGLSEELKQMLSKKKRKQRYKELNLIRVNNIYTTLWSHSGTVLAFAFTVFSIVFSIIWAIFTFYYNSNPEGFPLYYNNKILTILVLFIIIDFIIVLISPLLLRKIIDHLPSKSYSSLSLSNLNQSQVLTFVSLKYWELCNEFILNVRLGDEITKLSKTENEKEFSDIFTMFETEDWITIFEEFRDNTVNFKANYYKKISNAKALKKETTFKLNILPIEFSHHITKFSPYIFELRVETLLHASESMLYLLKNKDFGSIRYLYEFREVLSEVSSIINDIVDRRKRSLIQLIAFDNIHSYIIGLASATSTSKSLKIFTRGLSKLIEKSLVEATEEKKYEDFKALLHRSKAHYGFDLLISLENFYSKNYKNEHEFKIPSLLSQIKNNQKDDLDLTELDLLKNIRENLVKKYENAMTKISESFIIKFEELIKKENKLNIYIMIFGYSRIVKNVLQKNHNLLKKNKAKIFVMKEEDEHMLDTRILRFELNDKKGMEIRDSFTGSDDFFKRLLRKDDVLIMMAGAEAYDSTNSRLYHTNNYQKRVENFLEFLNRNESIKPSPRLWVVAGNYKVYTNFPDFQLSNKTAIGNEFFVDHYDKVDIYNFKDLGLTVELITDDDSEIETKNET